MKNRISERLTCENNKDDDHEEEELESIAKRFET